jgi:hypothetical protein
LPTPFPALSKALSDPRAPQPMADVSPTPGPESKNGRTSPDPVDAAVGSNAAAAAASADGSRTMSVGGVECEFFNDREYARIRGLWKVPDDFLADFDWRGLAPGGGKGGNPLAFTCNRTVIVKQVEGSDNDMLLLNAKLFADQGAKDTFMVRFFCHFRSLASGVSYIAMNNCLPISKGLRWAEVFDLKGCRDDKLLILNGEPVPEVHKRCFAFWNCWYMCCCNTNDRQRYYDGKAHALDCKFHCTPAQKTMIVEKLRRDCAFLRENGLMDYSLILGVIEFKSVAEAAAKLPLGAAGDDLQPFVAQHRGTVYAYYMGVIDFLQEWTRGKKVAAVIKECFAPKPISTVNPKRYADQFFSYFEQKFVADGSAVDLGQEFEQRKSINRGKSLVLSHTLDSHAPASPQLELVRAGEGANGIHSARSMRLMKDGSAVPPRHSDADRAKANGERPAQSA